MNTPITSGSDIVRALAVRSVKIPENVTIYDQEPGDSKVVSDTPVVCPGGK